MSNQKPENKSGDHDDGDHYQPINLVATRTAVPVTTFSASGTTVSTQPLAMRTHMDSKPGGLMTLYFRTQSPRTQGQVMGPIVGAQVSSSQHFAAKSAQDFKNTTSFTVIRMPSDMSQVQGSTATPTSSGSLTPGILPSALSGGSNRHMMPAAVQPVIAASHSGALASLIRGSHQVSPASHVIHPPFSSHVPRGPAAVASISAAPKSAVATPILRTPHSSATMALASSSMMALHPPVRVKSPTITGRTATPPVASTTSMPQVVDLQKTSMGHTLPSSGAHVGLSSRSIEGSIMRSANAHSSSITIAKPVNISQPIVQHLQQQVYDKGGLKTVSSLVPTTTTSTSSSHQSASSAFTSVNETSGVPTISRTSVSSSYSSIMQLPSSNVGQPLQPLRTTHVQQGIHAITNVSTSGTPHQTLTVIAAKSLMPANHSIALATPTPRSATPVTTVSTAGGNISIVPGPTARSLTLTSAVSPSSIPVAKVYPQSSVAARSTTVESTTQDSIRGSNFIAQGLVSNTSRVTAPTTTTSSGPTSSTSEKPPESSALRFTSLSKPQGGSSTSYTPSSTTYLYQDQYASNLSMHHYNSNSSSSSFTTHLRSVPFSQHSSNASSHPPVSVSNPVMVAVDSRHHMSLHSPYTSSTGKGTDLTIPTPLTSSVTTTTSVAVTSVVTTTYSSLQSQSTVNNHTSPRPSILRKRPSDSICTNVAKKNLAGSLCSTEPVSPRPDNIGTSLNFTSVLSPKPVSDKPKEAAPPTVSAVTESQNILIPVIPTISIKKEPGVTENSSSSTETNAKDTRAVEASPRKKPRKQLLATNELMETHSSDGEENNFDMKVKVKEEPGVKEEEKSKCITFYKRPSMSLLSAYRQTWKARHNHFARYCDVKPKEEKKPTVSELANQKGILQQANGWKIYHLTAQMDEVIELEETVYSRLSDLLDFVENDSPAFKKINSLNTDEARIINKLTDLIKGNLQRSKIVQEQVLESKTQAVKVLDHKSNVIEMVNKYISKRPLKKKEKS